MFANGSGPEDGKHNRQDCNFPYPGNINVANAEQRPRGFPKSAAHSAPGPVLLVSRFFVTSRRYPESSTTLQRRTFQTEIGKIGQKEGVLLWTSIEFGASLQSPNSGLSEMVPSNATPSVQAK